MEREKKANKNTSVIILSILLAIIIILFVGYILVDKEIINLNNNAKEPAIKEEKSEQDVNEEYSLEDAKKLLIKHRFTSEDGPVRYLVGTVYEFGYDDQYKAYVATRNVEDTQQNLTTIKCSDLYQDNLKQIPDNYNGYTYEDNNVAGFCMGDDDIKVIPYDTVNKEHKELYGTELKKESFNFNVNPYIYSKKHNGYVALSCQCGGTWGPSIHIDEIKEAKLESNILTIYVYNEVITATGNNDILYYHIKNASYNTKEKTEAAIKQDIVTNHLDCMKLYEIKFEKKGDNFIFKSLSQVLS